MILLINDDGIAAPGLRSLYHALRTRCGQPVLAVAPAQQHSGQSHAITLDRGLTINSHVDGDFFGFSIDGTPADCLKLAVTVLCQQPPKIVVSGINDGPNVGRSLVYSGTVGAAMEAAVEGFAAIAASRDTGAGDPKEAAEWTADFVKQCLGRRDLRGTVLNVNLPATPSSEWQPACIVEHGRSGFDEKYQPRRNRAGNITWHLHGTRVELEDEGITDAHLLAAGHVTVSLLRPDFNARTSNLAERLAERLDLTVISSA